MSGWPSRLPGPLHHADATAGTNGGQANWKAESSYAMGGCDFADSGRAAAAQHRLTLPSTDCTRPTVYIWRSCYLTLPDLRG